MNRRTVLFICTHNSSRSIMAEAILRELGGDRFEAISAGTLPRGAHPLALKVLEEKEFGTEGLRSRSVEEFQGREVDLVITLCDTAKVACPLFPGAKQYWHKAFEDPSEGGVDGMEQLERFRRTRDEIVAYLSLNLIGKDLSVLNMDGT